MIETRIQVVDREQPDPAVIAEAADVLKRGGLVAFPTETVYGLGADALNVDAVRKVFQAKGRPSDNPMIVHFSSHAQLAELADEISKKGMMLAETFWPGPLTLVVDRTILVSEVVTGGLETVAVRMPDHPVALALIEALGSGIVGPSANLSTRPSPTTAIHVLEDLKGRIELILDAGPSDIGIESTVVDVTVDPPQILRLGGLTAEMIESVIGEVQIGRDDDRLKRSPGTRYRHYAPRARVVLIDQCDRERLEVLIQQYRQEGNQVGCIVHSGDLATVESSQFFHVLPSDTEFLARYLYRSLRELDQMKADVILVEKVREEGLGATVMDRLRKAARSTPDDA
ncbi:MAG: threonylcarbamoyl-AMP synthase [Ignavibacteria bacterium]|nr:threonylcarbamoyl-AMP synthase [Ignavibacteria bacterium]